MFIGQVHPRGDSVGRPERASLRQAVSPYHQPDADGLFIGDGAWLYEQRIFNHAANRDANLPLRCPDTGVVLAFWGRLDNRSDLIARLGRRDAILDGGTPTDGELVLAAWRRWGEALPEQLVGDFALVILDPRQQRLFLARDPLGVKPLYYVQSGDRFAFASSVAALRRLEGLDLTPDTEWMARYLLFQHVMNLPEQGARTGYREVLKLLPGHALTLDADGGQTLWRYHAWRDDAPATRRRDPRWVDAYRAVLEEAIRCRMASDFPLGTENSGGIDSATITAYLAHFLGDPGDRLHSFGFALCEQEPGYILETSRAKGITHNYIVTTHGGHELEDLDFGRALDVLGYPEEHESGSDHLLLYRECAQRNIRMLFSGFGGDEVVTNPGALLRYELLDSRAYGSLWGILPGDPLRRALRFAKAATIGRRSPGYRPTYRRAWQDRWPHYLLRPEVVEHLDLHREYMETARYDAPYRRINDFILQGLLRMPYVHCRLEASTLMAASYGLEYRWPLWDIRLVQQYLSTPSIEKVGPGGIGRYLHRRAIDGVVPRRVAWKPSKDMGYAAFNQQVLASGLPVWAERLRKLDADLHPTLAALLDRGQLRQQMQVASRGQGDQNFAFIFGANVAAIRWLDAWLKRDVG
jgi:asparagine synthase (glutamine-hydrolysing)